MRKITLFIVSFIMWLLLIWHGRWQSWQDIIAGLVAALLTAQIFGETPKGKNIRPFTIEKLFWIIYYIPVFSYKCLLANLDLVYRVLHPDMPINPGIVKVKTELKSNLGRTALCNSITLVPGTLTVDLTKDGYIYVHWSDVKSQDVEKATGLIVKQYETILKRIFE